MHSRIRYLNHLGQGEAQHAVLKTVVEEDIREAGADEAPDTKIIQRPWRVLPRAPAAKIGPSHEDLGVVIRGLVQDKARICLTVL